MQPSLKFPILAIYSFVLGLDLTVAMSLVNESTDLSCSYTFNVPSASEIHCESSGSEDLERVKYAVSKQETALARLSADVAKLNTDMRGFKESLGRLFQTQEDYNHLVRDIGINQNIGTTYIRWGSSRCPYTASLLYNGYTAKSHANQGGGVNYICLPMAPEFHPESLMGHQSESYVYGTEYHPVKSPLVGTDRHNQDVPCAMCEVNGRSRMIVLIAHNSCPRGWTQEYEGFLMSQHHDEKGATFECVDKILEGIHGSQDEDGGLFYVVEIVCGSLPCPPYTEGVDLSCLVCTK